MSLYTERHSRLRFHTVKPNSAKNVFWKFILFFSLQNNKSGGKKRQYKCACCERLNKCIIYPRQTPNMKKNKKEKTYYYNLQSIFFFFFAMRITRQFDCICVTLSTQASYAERHKKPGAGWFIPKTNIHFNIILTSTTVYSSRLLYVFKNINNEPIPT